MLEIITSIDFLKFLVPVIGAVGAWFANEWRKRIWDQAQRKEEKYKQLLLCLEGFYVDASNPVELKTKFVTEITQCWLYCPDEVILKGYAFLGTINVESNSSSEDKLNALGEFVASIRIDLISRKLVKKTKLLGSDFFHMTFK